VNVAIRSAALTALVFLAAACSSEPPPAATAVTTANARPGCIVAPSDAVLTITTALTGDAKKVGETFGIEEGKRRYIGGNIYDGAGKSLSTGDVWIIEENKLYALSAGARSNTKAPDGRELPDKPASGVGNARFVSECARPS
jgi:hypothetical protein